jgi:hypothetical protein
MLIVVGEAGAQTARPHRQAHLFNGAAVGPARFGELGVSPVLLTQESLSCQSSSVVIGQSTTCTATLTDISAPDTPTGQVDIFQIGGVMGNPSGSPCTLSGSGTSSSCDVTYTGILGQAGHQTLGAAYEPTGDFAPNFGAEGIQVTFRPTSTQISCSPNPVTSGLSTVCTATVTDNGDPASAGSPTGTVTFASKKADQFNPASCTLSPATSTTSSCQTTDTPPTAKGTHAITARYDGENGDKPSTATSSITVTKATVAARA